MECSWYHLATRRLAFRRQTRLHFQVTSVRLEKCLRCEHSWPFFLAQVADMQSFFCGEIFVAWPCSHAHSDLPRAVRSVTTQLPILGLEKLRKSLWLGIYSLISYLFASNKNGMRSWRPLFHSSWTFHFSKWHCDGQWVACSLEARRAGCACSSDIYLALTRLCPLNVPHIWLHNKA